MRYLRLSEVLEIYRQVMKQTDGAIGVRDIGALESAVAQPQMTFGGKDLYPTIIDKAAALGFSIIQNHPFIDGNKRTGHATMETFLILNGYEIGAEVGKQVKIILSVASGEMDRKDFTNWLRENVIEMQ